jgi:glycosyltransferase involved in cell wall biosynthesis
VRIQPADVHAPYREVLTPEAAVSVRPDDPDALADAVAGLVSDEPGRERMGAAARELALERYSWSRVASRLEEIYAGLVGREVRAAA